VLGVSLRVTVGGFPSASNLTQGSADAGSTAGWVDVDFGPWVDLTGGQSYWVVLRSAAPPSLGYTWWHSGNEAAYPDGMSADSSDGASWSPRGRDFTFRIYGFTEPSLAFAESVSSANQRPGDHPVFRVAVTNSGAGDAPFVWVNMTLPSELTYLFDDAASVGGVRSGATNFTFTSVSLGSLTFNVTALVNAGSPIGSIATTVVTFDSTDHNGAALPRVTRSATITVVELPSAVPTWTWAFIAIAVAVALGAASFIVLRRRKSELSVEDVFVADLGGILLAHRAATIVPYGDEDVLIGMFKVVQDFVKDAFSRGTDEQMKALEFGDRKILIERGRNHFVAVVYRGTDRGELKDRVEGLSRAIDEQFGDVLASWDGSMDLVQGITHLLPSIWKARKVKPLRTGA